MDSTFIKTSQGIIRREFISFVGTLEDDAIAIHTIGDNIYLRLEGEEARAFLQILPIAADFTYLSKTELPEKEKFK